jgi:hypothetical protein
MAAAKSTRPRSGRSRAPSGRKPALRPSAGLLDAVQGIAWFNITPTERRYRLSVAGSAVPSNAWTVYKRNRRP